MYILVSWVSEIVGIPGKRGYGGGFSKLGKFRPQARQLEVFKVNRGLFSFPSSIALEGPT